MKRRTGLLASQEYSMVVPSRVDEPLDWTTAVKLFVDEQKLHNRTKRTLEWYHENLHALRVFLERQGIEPDVRTITTRLLKKSYVLYMLETLGLAPVTINGRIRTIKSFFRFLASDGHIPVDPAEPLNLLKASKTIIHAFTDDQVRALLGTADQRTFAGLRDYTIMCLMLETGLRVSEAAQLKLVDVRWREKLHIRFGQRLQRAHCTIPVQDEGAATEVCGGAG